MADITEQERKVLSYVSRGVNKNAAAEKIAEFFSMRAIDVNPVIEKLKRQGLVIESKSVSGVTVYMTSPLKVKSNMIDASVVEQLKAAEHGARASGFKKHTFDPNTGAVVTNHAPVKEPKKKADLGFDIE
jgi:hypothetical protein